MLVKEEELDPRVKRTRLLITEAFTELIDEKGFQSITVADITERATINRSTFYAHFEDKFDLFDFVVLSSFLETLHTKLPPGSDYCQDGLKTLILTVFEFLERFNSGCSAGEWQSRPMLETKVQSQVNELILGWIEQLQLDSWPLEAAPEVTASVLSWAIYGAGLHWSRNNSGQAAEDVADQVISLLSGSYPTPDVLAVP